MFTVVLFLLILSLLVLAHEFGHFFTARKSGMRVYEFGWGFPPRAFGAYKDPKTKKFVWVWGKGKSSIKDTVGGEESDAEFPATLYSVNWLPLGGFCKIKGENGEDKAEPDSFGYQKAWKKIIVLVAGVTMNFLLAGVLLSIGFMIGLPADMTGLDDKNAIIVEEPAVMIQQVEKNSPAEEAGLTVGDKILMINEIDIKYSGQMVALIKKIGTSGDMTIKINRGGEEKQIVANLGDNDENSRLGVYLADAGVIRYPWYLAVYKGFAAACIGVVNILIAFFLLIKNLVIGKGLSLDVSGPIGIAIVVGQSARMGFNYLLNVTAMISLSLAVINILPFPALDGGRALFILIEKFTGKKVPMKYEQLAHTIGFVLLMLLIVVVTFRDIKGLF